MNDLIEPKMFFVLLFCFEILGYSRLCGLTAIIKSPCLHVGKPEPEE